MHAHQLSKAMGLIVVLNKGSCWPKPHHGKQQKR